MKKAAVALALTGVMLATATPALAESNGVTVGIGYANSHLSQGVASENMSGFNLNVSKEWNAGIGGIVSGTYTQKSVTGGKLSYYDLMIGPSYSFNNYVKSYVMIGMTDLKISGSGNSYNQSAFGYGVGVQFYPVQNIAINIGYVGSNVKNGSGKINTNTWNIGVGYRF